MRFPLLNASLSSMLPPAHCFPQEIAQKKLADTNAVDLAGACRMVEGTARSLGLVVE